MSLDRTRLARLLGMLGSAHDGEIANAGRAANALVRAAGMTWFQVLAAPEPQDDIELCVRCAAALTEWERDFVLSVSGAPRLSQKQRQVLDRLVRKARLYARARGAAA